MTAPEDRPAGVPAAAQDPAAPPGPGSVPEVRFTYRGRPYTARAGQTAAAALMGNGIGAWRTTRAGGRPRGQFCGIGVCYDCLLRIDGEPDQRACLVDIAEGMALGEDEPGDAP